MNMHGNRLQQAMDESTAVTVRFFGGALPICFHSHWSERSRFLPQWTSSVGGPNLTLG